MSSVRPSTRSASSGQLPVLVFGGAVLVTALTAGCNMFGPKSDSGAGLPPILQRMQKAYPDDLASGRFVSLADFESRGQVLLFRTVGPDGTEDQRQEQAQRHGPEGHFRRIGRRLGIWHKPGWYHAGTGHRTVGPSERAAVN